MIQLLEQNLPASFLDNHSNILALVTAWAPIMVLGVEAAVPILLLLESRVGVFFTAVFHCLIAITPPPNNIATFGTQTLPRLILFIQDQDAAEAAVSSIVKFGWRGSIIVMFTALITAMQPITWTNAFDINVVICGGMGGILCVAAITASIGNVSKTKQANQKDIFTRISPNWTLITLTFIYSFVTIPLGVMDVGTSNMFSSLRMHGGTNHYIFPTSLLQYAFSNETIYPPDSLVGNIFGNGIIRVEATNSSHLTGPGSVKYPGELLNHSPRAVELLKQSGHSGRQWNPMTFACAIGNRLDSKVNQGHIPGLIDSSPFDPYTLPSAEFRNLIHIARSRFPLESFEIEGALLPGIEGDEEWRAKDAKARFRIHRKYSSSLNAENIECQNLETNLPCEEWLEKTLLQSPSKHWIAVFFRRILLQQPYPIVLEDAGPHRAVHCFGP